jgi:hypothetical protein
MFVTHFYVRDIVYVLVYQSDLNVWFVLKGQICFPFHAYCTAKYNVLTKHLLKGIETSSPWTTQDYSNCLFIQDPALCDVNINIGNPVFVLYLPSFKCKAACLSAVTTSILTLNSSGWESRVIGWHT